MRRIVYHISRLLILPFFLATLFLLSSHATSQQPPETWGDLSIEPTTSSGQLHSLQEHEEARLNHRLYFGGKPCEEKTFLTNARDHMTACWYENEAGYFIDGGGVFVPHGSDQARFPHDYEFSVFPTWYKDAVLVVANDSSYAEIRRGTTLGHSVIEDPNGVAPNYFSWNNPASLRLEDENGNPYNMSDLDIHSQVAYSENGRWLLLFNSDGLLIRIDLEYLTISSFDASEQSNSDYWAATAISNSGRYIAAYEYGYEFLIIDTRGCVQAVAFIDDSPETGACSARSIKGYVWDNFSDFASIFPQFYGDDVLRIHGINSLGAAPEQVIQAPNTNFLINYIALGDSYTSGEGAYGYYSSTNEPNNRCHLARTAYPFILHNLIDINSTYSVACSGAVINDIASIDNLDNHELQNTKPANTELVDAWTPGYILQLDHVKRSNVPVSVVTVGIGGNDIGFGDIIKNCLGWGNCFDNFIERVELALEIQGQFHRLVALFSEIREAVLYKTPNGRVFAIGYPHIAAVNGNCGLNVHLSNDEIKLSSEIISYLNTVIRTAALKAGINYISVESSFRGHRLCEGSRTIAVNGLGLGDGAPFPGVGFFANESYHPTVFGHTLLARDITAGSNKLFRTLPSPSENVQPPTFLKSSLVMNAEDLPTGLKRRVYKKDLSADVVIRNGVQTVNIHGEDGGLLHSSQFNVEYHSSPTHIGTFLSDSEGGLSFTYRVPSDLPTGFHTIHILGKNSQLEDVDMYKTVYVAHSYDDMDGNGVNDTDELCGPFIESGVDEDKDVIDDGCDPVIDKSDDSHASALLYTQVSSGKILKPALRTQRERDDKYEKNSTSNNHIARKNITKKQAYLIVSILVLLLYYGLRVWKQNKEVY